MDCFFHEGIKVLYRIALVILNLFHKECQSNNEWSPDNIKNDIASALIKFCKKIPVSPAKLLHAAFSIRGLRYIILLLRNEKYFKDILLIGFFCFRFLVPHIFLEYF